MFKDDLECPKDFMSCLCSNLGLRKQMQMAATDITRKAEELELAVQGLRNFTKKINKKQRTVFSNSHQPILKYGIYTILFYKLRTQWLDTGVCFWNTPFQDCQTRFTGC